jgi:hypothetical protein
MNQISVHSDVDFYWKAESVLILPFITLKNVLVYNAAGAAKW